MPQLTTGCACRHYALQICGISKLLLRQPFEESRKQRDLLKPHGLREAEHEVHVLDRLPGRALDQVVEGRADDGAALDAICGDADESHVGTTHVAGLRHLA